ncbi:probable protein phosphatase CG10417 [Anopheles ziemanni]|uniref:probable protein phosphatase CG10417 n=1 Tax=Anopheles coustani TaxID=139045 RepID=UPI0026589F1D|nr:probable protein phosphatase CG10417 [Anopheles coustani]XP_058168282.1 probable protein phosphatase CG10417 [Anopheles ziemanni]
MGAYLSEPQTKKDSSDESNDYLICGSSSMQGWRVSQEDAHNCILNFDDNASFFAVYDGHGGAEVAQYCSLHLPSFLKTVEAYGRKNFTQALKDAFIGFDATLLEERVIEVLKQLSDKTNGEEEADEDEEEEEYDNVEDLCKEAMMPLNDVLQRYCKEVKMAGAASNQRVAMVAKEGNSSKSVSPYLKGKRRGMAGGSSGADDTDEPGGSSSSSSAGASAAAAGGSSSSSAPVSSGEADPAAQESKPVSTASADAADSTVSSSEEQVLRETAAVSVQEPSSSSSSAETSDVTLAALAASAAATTAVGIGSKTAEQSNEISDTEGIVPANAVARGEASASGAASAAVKENCAPDSSSSDGSRQLLAGRLNGDVKVGGTSSGAVSSSCSSSSTPAAPAGSSASRENGVVGSASSGGSKSASPAAAAPKVHSTATGEVVKKESKNGPSSADVSMNDDDTDDDDESDSDEEFPHVGEPADDTSSTEDGEEDPYGEDGSEDDEDGEEEGEYEEEEDLMNEEDAAFMKNISDEPGKDSGCTAVVALLHGKDLYVANAGDSRCVVCRNGQALEMSFDHKPEDTIEYERIEKAGGRVTLDGRVNGGLNLSRAIGDHGYKTNKSLPPQEQMISALPDIQHITVGPEDDFMVLACDGIWNFMTSDEVVQFVQERIHEPDAKLSKICEELFDNCLAPHTKGDGTGCDNMTAIIVKFKPNFTGSSASRKRTASASVDTPEPSSATKKVKTDAVPACAPDGASSTTEVESCSNGATKPETDQEPPADATEEMEAAAAVASIDGSSEAATSSSST